MNILHHGAVNGVTGSCHELRYGTADENGILIDCGLFQGAELSGSGDSHAEQLQIDFPISHIKALVVTHVHIDHVGRIPYLLAAGFDGPIICTEPSAHLLLAKGLLLFSSIFALLEFCTLFGTLC
jgi:metallo-beta-lactamase family protein